MKKEAYFVGGCFWCVIPIYKMYGVDKVICGYAGAMKKTQPMSRLNIKRPDIEKPLSSFLIT